MTQGGGRIGAFAYTLREGWTVLAGRTDADNERLSLKVARPEDWWFHVRGMPGSHVILQGPPGDDPDRETLRRAAAVAAYHSKARAGGEVAVSCTRARYVTKPRGAKAGTVQIHKEVVLKVRPAIPALPGEVGEPLLCLSTNSRMIDVSHTIEHGMVTYKGLPAPLICDYLSREASRSRYAAGTEFQIGKIEMVANTGTYVDSPFHRYAGGKDLAALPLDSLANLDCVVVRVPAASARAIDRLPLTPGDVQGRAVLVHTGWDRHWRTDAYGEGHPFLTRPLAEWLVKAGAVLVGIDSFNIDSTDTGERPVHTELLGHDIPIVEHLRGLAALPERGSRFFAVPVKVRAFGSFPVRAFALA